MAIRHVVFDFDGSCTLVQDISDRFLAEYGRRFAQSDARIPREWEAALEVVRRRSPHSGWMLGGKPSAPCAADPYILAFEAARYLTWKLDLGPIPDDLHGLAYDHAIAGLRPDLTMVLRELTARGLHVSFVSNSSTTRIQSRLTEHLAGEPRVLEKIRVIGDAAKFAIREIRPDAAVPAALAVLFDRVDATTVVKELDRSIYLRRGAYMEALSKVWNNRAAAVEETLVCGDIWELDLALPAALGAQVHLITRAAPYDTYPYELEATRATGSQGGTSSDLAGILDRLGV